MAHDVFISYSTKDRAVADALCATMESNGIKCWIAPRDILSGQNWPTAITNGIAGSRIMVLVFSSKSNKSEDVTREVYQAVQKKIKIIPFRVESVALSDELAYLIGSLQWLDASKPPTKSDFEHLTRKVCLMVGKPFAGDRAEPPPPAPPRPKARMIEKSLSGFKKAEATLEAPSAAADTSSRLRIPIIAAVVLLLGLGSYSLMNYLSGPLPDVITIEVDVRVEGTTAYINIRDDANASIPIKVNGQLTGDTTPYSEQKHFGDKLVLTLSKEGYRDVNLNYALRNSFSKSVNMVKAGK